LLILASDKAQVAVIAIRGHGFADHDLEVVSLVIPVPDIAAVEANDDESIKMCGELRLRRLVWGHHLRAWLGTIF
jgi:hypothetical protein